MNLYECKDFFRQSYPEKKIDFSFDEKCYRSFIVTFTEGNPNEMHHIDHNKVKVEVEGMAPIYVPILTHRETCEWGKVREFVLSKNALK